MMCVHWMHRGGEMMLRVLEDEGDPLLRSPTTVRGEWPEADACRMLLSYADLLDVCKRVVLAEDGLDDMYEVVAAARTAIAKATGE